jgi:hypothetical protein
LPIPDGGEPTEEVLTRTKKDAAFFSDTGNNEDAKVVSDIQAAIDSGANTYYQFGRFESAIGRHFQTSKSLTHHLTIGLIN